MLWDSSGSVAQHLHHALSLCTSLCTLMWSRIRCEAAMALGTTASSDTEFAGLHALLKIFRARCHSSSASEQQPQIGQAQAGSNVGEYLVNETLPLAIACVRDEKGFSAPEAVEVLVSNFSSNCRGFCGRVRGTASVWGRWAHPCQKLQKNMRHTSMEL